MMLAGVLAEQRKKCAPDSFEIKRIRREVASLVLSLQKALKKRRVAAIVFVGGSFAKGTLVRRENYDVDIFVRFAARYENISELLAPAVKEIAQQNGLHMTKIHGSRDYFRLEKKGFAVIFEIVPVRAVARVRDAENVTDLSYFHVSYVKKKIHGLENDVRLAKEFCRAAKVYGAESYVHGFSGYALECLIIHYKGFAKWLSAFSKLNEKIVLDPAKHYANAHEALISLNEAKTQNPAVLVDPTCKERNVLAALNSESFSLFQKTARSFLKSPRASFFSENSFNIEQMRKRAVRNKCAFVLIELETDRQAGDIAGTKLKKVAKFIEEQLEKCFMIRQSYFDYEGSQEARLYLLLKERVFAIRRGPPKSMNEDVKTFKKIHPKAFMKRGRWWARVALETNPVSAVENLNLSKEQLYQMGVTKLNVVRVE